MNDDEKQDFFTAIKHGSIWYDKKITECLRELLEKQSSHYVNHDLRWDKDDKYHYIYDNECYLFVFNDKIEVRSDRENVFSSHQTIVFPIAGKADILNAYQKFVSMTMEDEDE
jgi:hypothetical protein